jgi:hypothetical protein
LIAVERGTSIRALIDEIDRTGRCLHTENLAHLAY